MLKDEVTRTKSYHEKTTISYFVVIPTAEFEHPVNSIPILTPMTLFDKLNFFPDLQDLSIKRHWQKKTLKLSKTTGLPAWLHATRQMHARSAPHAERERKSKEFFHSPSGKGRCFTLSVISFKAERAKMRRREVAFLSFFLRNSEDGRLFPLFFAFLRAIFSRSRARPEKVICFLFILGGVTRRQVPLEMGLWQDLASIGLEVFNVRRKCMLQKRAAHRNNNKVNARDFI